MKHSYANFKAVFQKGELVVCPIKGLLKGETKRKYYKEIFI